MKIIYTIATLTALLVLALAAAAFALSYDALRTLAQANGVTPGLTWLYPLVIDGVIVVASFSVLRNALLTERATFAWTLVIAFTALSTWFNVAHAEAKPLAQAVGAVPPLTLVLALELLMGQIRASMARYRTIAGLDELTHQVKEASVQLTRLTTLTDTRRAALAEMTQQVKVARTELADVSQRAASGSAAGAARVARMGEVARLMGEGQSRGQIAEALGVSPSTIKRDARELRVSENGKETASSAAQAGGWRAGEGA